MKRPKIRFSFLVHVCVFVEVVGFLEVLEERTTSSSLLNVDRRAKCDGIAANTLPSASAPHWEVD